MTIPSSHLYTLDTIKNAVDSLMAQINAHAVFTFSGPLGVGKTTLIRSLLEANGVSSMVTSPTYTYLHIYENDRAQRFFHFDLYRITSLDQFLEMGFDEYLYQPSSWCFIEWPTLIEPLLIKAVCHIELEYATLPQERLMAIRCSPHNNV